MTTYMQIYERFVRKINDILLLNASDDDAEKMLFGWLSSAIPHAMKIDSDLSNRDDEIRRFNSDLSDIEQEYLSCLMVTEWLKPQINSTLYTNQFFGSGEEKFFAQSNQLDKLMSLKKTNESETKKLRRDYGYQKMLEESEG